MNVNSMILHLHDYKAPELPLLLLHTFPPNKVALYVGVMVGSHPVIFMLEQSLHLN